MITLNFKTDTFDTKNTFRFAYTGHRGNERTAVGYLLDARESEGKIYLMQRSACLKDKYTEDDYAESERLNAMTPVRDADTVEVEGKHYRVTILGNYSDAGRLTPIN